MEEDDVIDNNDVEDEEVDDGEEADADDGDGGEEDEEEEEEETGAEAVAVREYDPRRAPGGPWPLTSRSRPPRVAPEDQVGVEVHMQKRGYTFQKIGPEVRRATGYDPPWGTWR